jgi:D-aspartate ligase
MKVLVLDCGYNGLAVIQSLGRKGVELYAVDQKRTVGTFSKYVKEYIKIDLNINEKKVIQTLVDLKFNSKVLIFPTSDRWIEIISRNKEELSKYYLLCAPENKIVELLLNKYEFGTWCEKKGIKTPRVYKESKALIFPIAVKTNSRGSVKTSNIKDSLRFKIVNNREELNHIENIAKLNNIEIYFQDVVQGNSASMHTIGIYANHGEIFGLFYGRKVRGFPPEFGDCIVGESLPVVEWVRVLSKTIVRELKYTGVAEIEIMQDRVTGEFYIIEINPRSWSWVGITGFSGVDIPWIAYSHLTSPGSVAYTENTKFYVRYSKVISDFTNVMFEYKKTSAPEWSLGLKAWIKEYIKTENTIAEFQKDDLIISLYSISHYIYSRIRKLLKLR